MRKESFGPGGASAPPTQDSPTQRSRRNWKTVLAAAVVITALPAGAAVAAPQASRPKALRTAEPRRSTTVTLITGDRVRVDGFGPKQRLETQPAQSTGPAHRLLTYHLGTDAYVMPATARPYAGRLLDRSLFDVTRQRAGARADGRVPVRLSYTGARPTVPGVTVTSAAGGTATGYLTPDSAATFGAALARQFAIDAKAGFPRRKTLFTGVTRIASDLPATGGVTPKYPMFTLRLTATGVDGAPLDNVFGILMNVDDGRKYGGFVDISDGKGRVSVPAGHYTLIGDSYEYDEDAETSTERLATVNEYVVSGAGQTLTLDFRRATVKAGGVVIPKPATVSDYGFEWDRFDATGQSSIGWGIGAGPGFDLFVAPSTTPVVGSLHVLQTWNADGPGATPAYVFNLATQYTRIPEGLTKTFRLADLATVKSTYFTDGPDRAAGFLRFPVYPWQFWVGGSFSDLRAPTTRTEYVAGTGSPRWGESYLANADSWDDPGFWDSNVWTTLPAGLKTEREWLRGALGPGIPVQNTGFNYCYGCRTSHGLSLGLAPALDSTPDHSSEIFGSSDGIPVARFRFYRNGELVSDQDDWLGGYFEVPSATASYKAVLDVDRRLTDARQASRTSTEVTFSSAAGQGGPLPRDWFCDTGEFGSGLGCRVLPIVTAKLRLPTDTRGRMPAGKATVTVTVARQQNAATGPAASAGLEVRYPGWFWEPVTLKPAGNGTWTGVVDSTDLEGENVDVRVRGADTAGNTFTQTILKAYTVAGQ